MKNTRGDIEDPNDRLFKVQIGSPERNLLCSILDRAVIDLKSDDPEARRSAARWLFTDHPALLLPAFSFQWCMQTLGWGGCVPVFRTKCREVIRLKAELGDVMLAPTSNFESLFAVEPYSEKRKRKAEGN